jgi:hypothetical protein
MSTATLSLEDVIRQSGEGWLIDRYVPKEEALSHLRTTLEAVNRKARERLRDNAPDLSEKSIIDAYHRRPQQIRGFFQALGGTRTPDMLLMVWRIIEGLEIKEIQLTYRRREQFEVRVVLESSIGEADEFYASSSVHDFALFRHIGVLEAGGRPVFDGFYALKVREA